MPRKSKENIKQTTNRLPTTAKKTVSRSQLTVSKPNHSQITQGRVVSAKTPQTVTVLVERQVVDPFYHKAFKRSKRFLAHDTLGAREGDIVEIVQVKPVSKNKHFTVIKVIGRDIEAIVTEELKEKAAEAIEEVMPEEKEEDIKDNGESEKPVKKERKGK